MLVIIILITETWISVTHACTSAKTLIAWSIMPIMSTKRILCNSIAMFVALHKYRNQTALDSFAEWWASSCGMILIFLLFGFFRMCLYMCMQFGCCVWSNICDGFGIFVVLDLLACVYTYIYTHIYKYIYIYICIHMCIYTYIYICRYV